MNKNEINSHLEDAVIQENGSSFLDITSVTSLKSTICESSNATVVTVGSEPPESISAYSESRHEINTEKQIGEVCSRCFQKSREEVAATHFCKQCKPFGKYLCYKCLKDHNAWSGHKNIYSLSEWKCKKTEKIGASSIGQKSNGSDENNFLYNWLTELPTSVAESDISVTSTTTDQESAGYYHSLPSSDVYDEAPTQTQRTLQSPSADYSSIGCFDVQTSRPTHDVRQINRGDARLKEHPTLVKEPDGSVHTVTNDECETYYDLPSDNTEKAVSPWTLLTAPEASTKTKEQSKIMYNKRYDKLTTSNDKQDQNRKYDELERLECVYPIANENENNLYDMSKIDIAVYEELPQLPIPRNPRNSSEKKEISPWTPPAPEVSTQRKGESEVVSNKRNDKLTTNYDKQDQNRRYDELERLEFVRPLSNEGENNFFDTSVIEYDELPPCPMPRYENMRNYRFDKFRTNPLFKETDISSTKKDAKSRCSII